MSKNTKTYTNQLSSYVTQLILLGFDITQVSYRAVNNWSVNTIVAVLNFSNALRKAPYHLSHQEIMQIADFQDGAKIIETIYYADKEFQLLRMHSSNLVALVSNCRSIKNIAAIRYSFS